MYPPYFLKIHADYVKAIHEQFTKMLSLDNSSEMELYKALKEKIYNQIRSNTLRGQASIALTDEESNLISYIEETDYGAFNIGWTVQYGQFLQAELQMDMCICTLNTAPAFGSDVPNKIYLKVSWDDISKMFDVYASSISLMNRLIKTFSKGI